MNATWTRLARRVDAMSVRERVIMGASLAAALAALVDFLVLTPQFAAQDALMRRLKSESTELAGLRAQLMAPVVQTPYSRMAKTLQDRQRELAALDQRVGARLAGHAASAQLPDLLRQVLARHEALTLLKLDTVAPAPDDPVVRRAVDLQLAGRYADLAAYALAIERQLPGLHWASLRIETPASGDGRAAASAEPLAAGFATAPIPAPTAPGAPGQASATLIARVWLPGVGS